ncbi:Lanthionine synthetase C-like protein [Marininema mesophilum]|uniref:Lanthionine synthetase C-like protein n=1 Tax=Marininema mesophilum TaxID=1048340 RepID=A0A1H2WK37_9BACL|nr:lanthionine synthetase C family protein [Marininema mesophilum]SDW81002.1 Lanthionine synthetase C-like protein [Marininema mesophilum]
MATTVRELPTSRKVTLRKNAEQVLGVIADRLRNPEYIRKVALHPNNVSSQAKAHPWGELSLSHGYPGTALLYGELDRFDPQAGWDQVAHQHLVAMQRYLEAEGFQSISLFGGITGVAFATWSASREGERYGRLLEQLHTQIAESLRKQLRIERERRSKEKGVLAQWYDIIVGITGVGRYLLIQKDQPELRELLDEILLDLVELSKPIVVERQTVPGWWIPQHAQFTEHDRQSFAKGNFNCGLAHGIPGPLALLSLAKLQGVEVKGQVEAIQRMTQWLLQWKQEDAYGSYWYDRVAWEEEVEGARLTHRHREAWCYGTPGVARALYFAGKALQDEGLKETSVLAYQSIFKRPEILWDIDSPTICHGTAGLLEMTGQMYWDSNDRTLQIQRDYLLHRQLKDFNPDSPFGYKDLEPQPIGYRGLDKVGLLEGAVGVALSLLSCVKGKGSGWSRSLLLH